MKTVETEGASEFYGWGYGFRRIKAGEVIHRLQQKGFAVEAYSDPVLIVDGELVRVPGATVLEVSPAR